MKCFLSITFLILARFAALAQDNPSELKAHFHHVHLNVVDPKAAVEFYTSKFACERASFADQPDAVWAQKSWLLFNKVKTAPKLDLTSAIWHIGWGAEKMPETYAQHQAWGTRFFEPLNDISDIFGTGGAKGYFYYAYVQSPDNALIELNTEPHHHFGHLHLFSAAPIAAAQWWKQHFGVRLAPNLQAQATREPIRYRGLQITPNASFKVDNVNVIIFPLEYAKQAYSQQWQGRTTFASTKDKAIDHIALSVDNLAQTLKQMKAEGVKIVQGIKPIKGTKIKSAFITGPDNLLFELVEGHAHYGKP